MSYVTLNSSVVLYKCKSILMEIKDKRKQENDKSIRDVMKVKRRRWNLKPYYFTEEQAIKYLDKWSDFMGWRSLYGYDVQWEIEELIALAELGNPVHISGKHAKILNKI